MPPSFRAPGFPGRHSDRGSPCKGGVGSPRPKPDITLARSGYQQKACVALSSKSHVARGMVTSPRNTLRASVPRCHMDTCRRRVASWAGSTWYCRGGTGRQPGLPGPLPGRRHPAPGCPDHPHPCPSPCPPAVGPRRAKQVAIGNTDFCKTLKDHSASPSHVFCLISTYVESMSAVLNLEQAGDIDSFKCLSDVF